MQNIDYIRKIDSLSDMLAILIVEQESYAYIDKLSNAPSKDLALLYLREALRDLHSLSNKERFENPKIQEEISKLKSNLSNIEKGIELLHAKDDKKELREFVSMVAAKALTKAMRLKEDQSKMVSNKNE